MRMKRLANERGKMEWSWLHGKYSFSFGSYFDPKWMGFSKLRVINEDKIDAGRGFDFHPHRDMEILSFVLEGSLEHKDTMGNHNVIRPGVIQAMSAGTGVEHSEYNPSSDGQTHMLQIWIETDTKNLKPSYQEYKYPQTKNELVKLGGKQTKIGVEINQDVEIFLGQFSNIKKSIPLDGNYHYWLQAFSGSGEIDLETVKAGDGLAIRDEGHLSIAVLSELRFLLFKLPKI